MSWTAVLTVSEEFLYLQFDWYVSSEIYYEKWVREIKRRVLVEHFQGDPLDIEPQTRTFNTQFNSPKQKLKCNTLNIMILMGGKISFTAVI